MTHLDSKANIDVDRLEGLRIAANINSGYIAPSLFQLIGYRQYIAKALLHGSDFGTSEQVLISEYDYLDQNIKKLLGI